MLLSVFHDDHWLPGIEHLRECTRIGYESAWRRHIMPALGHIDMEDIDVETVADNARIYGATRLGEMRRVIVHGLLHLCGQKDKTPRTNAAMHRKEDKYLRYWEEEK